MSVVYFPVKDKATFMTKKHHQVTKKKRKKNTFEIIDCFSWKSIFTKYLKAQPTNYNEILVMQSWLRLQETGKFLKSFKILNQ